MTHKITLTDREFAVVLVALRELAQKWIDPEDPELISLLANQFSTTNITKVIRADINSSLLLAELRQLRCLLPDYQMIKQQLYDGLVSEGEVEERYGKINTGVRERLEALCP